MSAPHFVSLVLVFAAGMLSIGSLVGPPEPGDKPVFVRNSVPAPQQPPPQQPPRQQPPRQQPPRQVPVQQPATQLTAPQLPAGPNGVSAPDTKAANGVAVEVKTVDFRPKRASALLRSLDYSATDFGSLMGSFRTQFNKTFTDPAIKQDNCGGAALVVVEDLKKDIILEGHDKKPNKWSPIAGKRDGNEPLAQTLFREVAEELGIVLLPEHVDYMDVSVVNSVKQGTTLMLVLMNSTGFSSSKFSEHFTKHRNKAAVKREFKEIDALRKIKLEEEKKEGWYGKEFIQAYDQFKKKAAAANLLPVHASEIITAFPDASGNQLELCRGTVNFAEVRNRGDVVDILKSFKDVEGLIGLQKSTEWLEFGNVSSFLLLLNNAVLYSHVLQQQETNKIVHMTEEMTNNANRFTGLVFVPVLIGAFDENDDNLKGLGSHYNLYIFNRRSKKCHVFDSLSKRTDEYAKNISDQLKNGSRHLKDTDFKLENHTTSIQKGASCGCWVVWYAMAYYFNVGGCVSFDDVVATSIVNEKGAGEDMWRKLTDEFTK